MAAIAAVKTYEYGTGTCTLRLVGQLSPLSQVADRPVLGRSRFQLQVHPEDSLGVGSTSPPIIWEINGREPQFSALAHLVQRYVRHHLSVDTLAVRTPITEGANSIQPVGLTRHRLTLASPEPTAVELSTLQLADLADALEQAETSLQILAEGDLPQAARPARPLRPRLPLWLGSVAAVGIAALLGNQFLTTAPTSVVLSPQPDQTSESAPQSATDPRPFALDQGPEGEMPEGMPESAMPESAMPGIIMPESRLESGIPEGDSSAIAPSGAPPAPRIPGAVPTPPLGTPKITPSPQPQPPTSGRTAAPTPETADSLSATRAPEEPTASAPLSAPPPQAQTQRVQPEAAAPEDRTARVGIAAAPAPDFGPAPDWVANLSLALEQQWRPPANLAAPLRYRLTLDPSGAITELTPLNRFSAQFPSDTLLPSVGTIIPGPTPAAVETVDVQFLPSGEVLVLPLPSPQEE